MLQQRPRNYFVEFFWQCGFDYIPSQSIGNCKPGVLPSSATDRVAASAADGDSYPQDRMFLTDDMLCPLPCTVPLDDSDLDQGVGACSISHFNPNPNLTPPHISYRAAAPAQPAAVGPCLQDLFTEQNARLQSWALRSQALIPSEPESQFDSPSQSEDRTGDICLQAACL